MEKKKVSTKILSSTIFNTDNNKKCYLSTKVWSVTATEHSVLPSQEYILKYMKTEHSYLKL